MATGRLPDPNTAPVTAKGDLYTYSTVPAKLAVGNDGETLVADSAASTGLRWQGNFAAGKNKIINGDFGIWQRGTSFSNPSSGSYTSDRWKLIHDGTGATRTISQQSFTAGTAPVSGYEGQFFYRYAVTAAGTGNTYQGFFQPIEDVRTLAGQTAVISFWAKAGSNLSMPIELVQVFGSGGSADVYATLSSSTISLTTSWQRFSVTTSVPSISGKTIGTNSLLRLGFYAPANSTATIDLWGVQAENGSTATAFQTATGTLAGELAACQRYYWRAGGDDAYQIYGVGIFDATTSAKVLLKNPVNMRVAPTSVDFSTIQMTDLYAASSAATGLTIDKASKETVSINLTGGSGQTQGRTAFARSNNSTSAYIGFSAEL